MTAGWAERNVDPTAGVSLYPRRVYCPRCGLEKGVQGHARPGVCKSCTSTMPAEDRHEWKRAA